MQKKIIIFGAGYHGRNAFRVCKYKKKFSVIYFADNNKSIQGKKKYGIKIIDPNKLNQIDFDKIIICGRYIPHLNDHLFKLNIDKSKILIWGKKELKLKKEYFLKRNNECINGLKKILKYLNEIKLNFWIDMGSLLCLARKQELADTSDVDLILNITEIKNIRKIYNKLKNEKHLQIKKSGYYQSKILNKKVPKFVIIKINNNINFEPAMFELNIFVEKNNFVENLAKKKFLKKNYWNETNYISYKKIKLPVPKNYKSYLEELYGRDWKIKKNFFNKF